VALIRACALPGPLLLATDGLSTYVKAFRKAFRSKEYAGRVGAPRLIAWPGVVIGQVVKRYQRRRVVGIERRLVQGSWSLLRRLLDRTQGEEGVLNAAYIERLNATFRARLAVLLVRRSRGAARRHARLHVGMYLVGTMCNFCTYHASLSSSPEGGRRTPAMAAGHTNHRWSMTEMLRYRVPPPCWRPPKRRGRRSKAMQQLIERWAA
jgi:hypothetical protein